MPKRTSNMKLDAVQNARRVVLESTEQASLDVVSNPSLLSQVMAEMGRRGGKIGGKRRLETMSDAQRTEVARKAAKARWGKKSKKK
jgi:hypothetical protein